MKNKLAFLFLLLCVAYTSFARNRQNFDCDWLFVLGNEDRMSAVGYDDSSWRKLDVPHDWAAEGDFSSCFRISCEACTAQEVAHCPEVLAGIESILRLTAMMAMRNTS